MNLNLWCISEVKNTILFRIILCVGSDFLYHQMFLSVMAGCNSFICGMFLRCPSYSQLPF